MNENPVNLQCEVDKYTFRVFNDFFTASAVDALLLFSHNFDVVCTFSQI